MGDGLRIELENAISFDEVAARLKRMGSILTAIDAGELLSHPPECPAARVNHAAALDLLALLHDEVQVLSAQFEGGWGNA